MFPAPSLRDMRRTLKDHHTEIIGVLFAPPWTMVGHENLAPRLGYLDLRTGQHIHFFCAGYGGYQFAQDAVPIAKMQYDDGLVIPWGFSQSKFVAFVNELESTTSWHYSGESDLILARPDLAFDDCIVFDIAAMLKGGAIDHPSRLFEAIINYASDKKEASSVAGFSNMEGAGVLGKAAVEGVLSLMPRPLRDLWKHGLHYRTKSLAKR